MTELDTLDEVEIALVERAADLTDIKDSRDRALFKLIFTEAKGAAIDARNALVAADPEDPKIIRHLQNEVKRYEEMADWVKTAATKADQTVQQLDALRGTPSGDDPADVD